MSPAYTFVNDLADGIPDIPPDSILSQTLHDDADVKATLFGFAPGQELTEHSVGQPAVLVFLKGEGSLELADDRHEARPGSWVHMPANLAHSVRAETELLFVLHLLK